MDRDERDNVIELKRTNQFTPDERQELFLLSLAECEGNVTKACEMSGVTRKEYKDWMATSDEFIAGVDDVGEQVLDMMVQVIIDAGKENNLTAAIYYTKCKGKHRGFVERQEITGGEGKPLTFEMNFINVGEPKKQITEE